MVCTFMTMLPATRIFASASSRDRKSTRLNSSHSQISYAVFCLKKKKNYSKYHNSPYDPNMTKERVATSTISKTLITIAPTIRHEHNQPTLSLHRSPTLSSMHL